MKFSKLSFVFFLLIAPIFCFAQNSPKEGEEPNGKPVLIPAPVALFTNQSDGWTINLNKKGGIMGISNLLVAINSNGQYLCGENDKMKTLSVTATPFLELSEMVDKLSENIHSKPINPNIVYCNDCIYNTLSFYRSKPGEKTFTANYATIPTFDAPTVKELYVKVWQVTGCDEAPKPKNKKD